jgi:hypothetical protein
VKKFLGALVGVILMTTAFTLPPGWGFIVGALCFALALHIYFFIPPYAGAYLIGIVITAELLGNFRPGLAILTGAICWGLAEVFAKRLHFTSRFARFIVGLVFLLIAYNFCLFGSNDALIRGITLLKLIPLLIFISYTFSTSKPHEFA